MKNQISFITGLFDSDETNPQAKNDGHLGEDLAKWLVEKSKGSEFQFGVPFQQDWGWTDVAEANGEKFILRFGILDGSVGADYADWRITIEKERKWKFLGAKDSPSRGRLCDLIHNILRDEGQIREVHWSE